VKVNGDGNYTKGVEEETDVVWACDEKGE